MRAFLFAWVATTFRRLRCQHVWTFDGTVLRTPREVASVRRRCTLCSAIQIAYETQEYQ